MLLLTLIAFDFFMRSMTRACNVVHYSSHAWWLIVAKVREWATVYLLRITSFSTVRQYCIMCGHGNAAWYSYVHIHEYSARHHKLPKYSPKRQRVTENHAVVNRIPYYGKFCVESDSRFRIVVPCTLHEIWQWKQSRVSLANGIAWF